MDNTDKLIIGGREFKSRLFVGTGKFRSPKIMAEAVEASEASVATVALKRVSLEKSDKYANLADYLDPKKYLVLPNTSGAVDADEAVRIARLGRAAGFGDFVKLEIHPDPNYLLPDPIETLKASKILADEGFKVMAYMNADPVLAMRLQDAGVAALMPLGAPIGTNRGLETRSQIEIIIEQADLPVVVDAGIGLPSHAAQAMEIGASAVLINTAIAVAENPVEMAKAFSLAVRAGRTARLSGAAATPPDYREPRQPSHAQAQQARSRAFWTNSHESYISRRIALARFACACRIFAKLPGINCGGRCKQGQGGFARRSRSPDFTGGGGRA